MARARWMSLWATVTPARAPHTHPRSGLCDLRGVPAPTKAMVQLRLKTEAKGKAISFADLALRAHISASGLRKLVNQVKGGKYIFRPRGRPTALPKSVEVRGPQGSCVT